MGASGKPSSSCCLDHAIFSRSTTSIMGGHASHKIVDQFIQSRYTKFGSVSSTRTKFALGTMVSRRIGGSLDPLQSRSRRSAS
mmetsp:Transcript_20389/g.36991  ORF Transcript_20389/g.36991 Transcript_20389/m.36991 type:complete len:83 (-) Transcript_20389:424-672(-)